MTYEQALTTAEDPFANSYAWLRIIGMEAGNCRVLLAVDHATGNATCFSFNKHNWQEQVLRVAKPDELAWEDQGMLISEVDKQQTDWHSGSLQDMLHYAEGLFR